MAVHVKNNNYSNTKNKNSITLNIRLIKNIWCKRTRQKYAQKIKRKYLFPFIGQNSRQK
jgi:hypothetical protein